MGSCDWYMWELWMMYVEIVACIYGELWVICVGICGLYIWGVMTGICGEK